MNKTIHLDMCHNCGAPYETERILLFELLEEEDLGALWELWEKGPSNVKCADCEAENPQDLPFSVYDPFSNRLFHYVPASCLPRMDLLAFFDAHGNPTADLIRCILWEIANNDGATSELLEWGIQEGSLDCRVFLSRWELFQTLDLILNVRRAQEHKRQQLRRLTPPAEFMAKGANRYKKGKLRFFYCVGQAFSDGVIYSASDIDQIIDRERAYMRPCEVQNVDARKAMTQLGLLECNSDATRYWRKPDPSKIDGLCFPPHVKSFENNGYTFYGDPELGFSACYRDEAEGSVVTFYVYGVPDKEMQSNSIEAEFTKAKEEISERYAAARSFVLLEEKQLATNKDDVHAGAICQMACAVTDSEGNCLRSYLAVTAWRGRFLKARMTMPAHIPEYRDTLLDWMLELLKQL